ncbi:MAG: class D beta-lactamase [Lachnospiraceae bacterium]|nr:class D beta-lactamase [Lachnospiraceae bacterium]
MKKRNNYFKMVCWVFVCVFILTGCSNNRSTEEKIFMDGEKEELEEEKMEEPEMESRGNFKDADTEDSIESIVMEPETVDADWSEYFNGLNGTAVVYDISNRRYTVYNSDLALTRSSPCSTFKIISSLIALENGIFEPEDSTRDWSGEIFWNEDWNKDIDFSEAFRTSCVWYYRQVIDDIGKDVMQKELDKLQYGNCDISDWEGRLNTNNNNRALTGFWIESSLIISPKEQVEVMERIFGDNSDYSEETLNELKQVMLVSEQDRADISIYGKTGMGKANGIVVDAWFTGFAEGREGKIYFCVYLGRTDGMNVSSPLTKEIAIQIVSDYYGR